MGVMANQPVKDPPYARASLPQPSNPYAIDKGRLYGIAELLDVEGYAACARDVRAAADFIATQIGGNDG